MLRCVSWIALREALNLLSSIDSCTPVWTIIGRLCSVKRFPRPRPRPPLWEGMVWLMLSSVAWDPPICLPSPPGDRVPLLLPPGPPFGGPLKPPLVPPLHRSRIFKCGSWWSPFSVAVLSAWIILNEKSFRSLIEARSVQLHVCRFRWSSLWWWVVRGTQRL